ncbi:hypothetical protein RFX30_05490, partial [Acinetobacter baumannii]|nr:hypothetical protein [Acinetobacter baumannii]
LGLKDRKAAARCREGKRERESERVRVGNCKRLNKLPLASLAAHCRPIDLLQMNSISPLVPPYF